MLGEMPVISGKVTTFGSVAYVSQEAWVISDTVRENILLGATRNANDYEHYNEVLETCELSQVRKSILFLSIGVNFFFKLCIIACQSDATCFFQ